MPDETRMNMDPAPGAPDANEDESRIRQFVSTPFSVRCNIVKVWHPLPSGFWGKLAKPEDAERGRRAERAAIVSVLAMAVVLVVGFSGVGIGTTLDGWYQCFPVVGKPAPRPTLDPKTLGWCFEFGRSFSAVFWTVGPSLAGWAFVRWLWIPMVVRNHPARAAAKTMAQHLGSVYLYVYLMICAGAVLMLVVARVAPAETAFIRWGFWCFLFGESFFVPGVMWIRLVLANQSAEVFGRFRIAWLAGYVVLFVVVPLYGMTLELD